MAINAPQIGTRPRRNEEEVRKLQCFPRIQWKRRSKERRELSSLIPTRTPMRALKPRGPREPPCEPSSLVAHANAHAGMRISQSPMLHNPRAAPMRARAACNPSCSAARAQYRTNTRQESGDLPHFAAGKNRKGARLAPRLRILVAPRILAGRFPIMVASK